MKPIRRLSEAGDGLKGLTRYREDSGDQANWNCFRRRYRRAYQELVQALCHVQHGLCGYCEINIIPQDKQVEHVVPRSHPSQGRAGELDPANMMLCCQGGTCPTNDNERKLRPIKENRSCGEAKENSMDPQFIDPRDLPPLPSLVRIDDEGEISADEDACKAAKIDVSRVEKTIRILGLNVKRLQKDRKQHWDDLSTNYQEYLKDPQKLEAMARMELLPGKDGRLPRFFSTSRSYFGPVAEQVLAEAPQEWI